MGKLDLSNLDIDDAKEVSRIFEAQRKDFSRLIDGLSEKHGGDIYWWITSLASRDTLLSPVYYQLCLVQFAVSKINSNPAISEVICPTSGIKKCLDKYYKSNSRVKFFIKNRNSIFRNVYYWYLAVKSLLIRFNLVNKYSKRCAKDIDCLIETDVFLNNVTEDGNYRAKDFKNAEKYTNHRLTILPYLQANDKPSQIVLLRRLYKVTNVDFIYREQYLNYKNLFEVAILKLHLIHLKQDMVLWYGIDVSDLLNESISKDAFSSNSIQALENFRFVENFYKEGGTIRKFIGWYEGQPSSILLHNAMHKFFPQVQTIGYTGLPITKNMIGVSQTDYMINQRFGPDLISVMGEKYTLVAKQFYDEVKVITAPSFRSDSMLNISRRENLTDNGIFKILVVLPYTHELCRTLLDCLFDAIRATFEVSRVSVTIKNHPTNLGCTVTDYGVKEQNIKVSYIEGDLLQATEGMDIAVLSGEGSTLLELLIKGIPFICFDQYSNLYGDILEGYGIEIPRVYNSDEMKKELHNIRNKDYHYYGNELKKSLTPINKDTVNRLFE